ncbi:MAG: molybdopterin-dependent oxidoreductase [Luteitalea sp.]|nr:molybdopterin-dependent oxidoreductase [Luteitalea sp.]
MDRRNFLKTSTVGGAAAALSSCGHPEAPLVRFLPDEELVPGVATWKPSVCPGCRAGCGVLVRVMEGDAEVIRNGQHGVVRMGVAKKLEGNPEHPISQGRLCPRGQAAIQLTYHPDRLGHPLERVGARGSGEYKPLDWDAAISTLVERLRALDDRRAHATLAALTRPLRGVRRELIARFLQAFGAGPPSVFELFSDDVLRRANERSFGRRQLPTFDLSRARYVISFGADFLGTWNSPVAQSAAYGEMRQGRPGIRGTFVQVEPRMSQTGANADRWVPVRPGTEGVLALGLAHVMLQRGLASASSGAAVGALIDGWDAGLPAYAPEAVERETGVAARRIARLASELAADRPAVAIIGGAPLAHTNGFFNAIAVNALNAVLDSVGRPGGMRFMPEARITLPEVRSETSTASSAAREQSFSLLRDRMRGVTGPGVEVLLLYDANPVFAAPRAWRIREALAQVPFIVSFGSFLDDTSTFADLILPDHSFLESWMDDAPESGSDRAVVSVAAPAMRPLHDTRATADVLLEIARQLGGRVSTALPWHSYEDALRAAVQSVDAGASADAKTSADVWTLVQQQGGWWTETLESSSSEMKRAAGASIRRATPRFDGDETEYPFHFLPYPSQAFLDGSLAHLPWMQELPDVLSTAMWGTWVEINPRTAERLGVSQGDLVEVASSQGRLEAPALVSPGIAPDVVAMPVGQGHRTFTRYASGRGANPVALLAPLVEPESGTLAWAATRVRVARKGRGRLTLFAGGLRERPGGVTR